MAEDGTDLARWGPFGLTHKWRYGLAGKAERHLEEQIAGDGAIATARELDAVALPHHDLVLPQSLGPLAGLLHPLDRWRVEVDDGAAISRGGELCAAPPVREQRNEAGLVSNQS